MGRPTSIVVALALAACVLPSCGVGEGQTRPVVVTTWPDNLQTVSGPVQELRVTWDGPVRLLNPGDLRVYDGSSLLLTVAVQRGSAPHSAFVRLQSGEPFPTERDLTLEVAEGAVVNTLDHYADEPFYSQFSSTSDTVVPVGLPGAVALFDLGTLTTLDTVPTPAGTEPVGLVATLGTGSVRRVWVQLDSGGGTGASLAWFDEGDAAMTPVALPTSGGDLLAVAAAIALTPDGRELYAAWRDEASGTVRLFRVDPVTGAVAGSLDLTSVTPGADTFPADLELQEGPAPDAVFVSAFDGASGTLAKVWRASLTEVDLAPLVAGVQGMTLDLDAGPLAPVFATVGVAPDGTTDLSLVTPGVGVSPRPSSIPGSTVEAFGTPDSVLIVQALSSFDADLGLVVRSVFADFGDPTARAVSDDVGGLAQGITDARALQWLGNSGLVAALFDSPAGLVMTLWAYGAGTLIQVDLDGVTAGVQAALVDAELPGAYLFGRTWGRYPPP